ncbi:LA_2168 family protein [Leptospira yasudae]|uniref:Alginate export domain-containing protein n=1 Tax=Leptospira yasudae TaxID=2202201 RepID=A0ABX9M1X9_9LEPT|nr:hypothetical protein [Leptospira yasudae]RHX79041.1 hypothetical protein DLM77_13855 [Leptospira yasudae]
MRRSFVYSFLLMCFPLYANDPASGWTSLGWMGWGLGASQKTENGFGNDDKSGTNKEYQEIRMNSSLFHAGMDRRMESERIDWKIQADLTASNESKLNFFAGKNLYVSLKRQNVSLSLGRVQEDKKQSSAFGDWADGTDGVTVRADFQERGRLRFDGFDFYSGYRLLEKHGWKDSILDTKGSKFGVDRKEETQTRENSSGVLPGESTTSGSSSNKNPDFGGFRNRYRGGVGYQIDVPFGEVGLAYQYLNLQNWGRYANDLDDKNRNVSSGDRDYLTHTTLEWKGQYAWFRWFLSGVLARGQDKTGWNRIRNAAAIPITGEAFFSSFGGEWKSWKFEVFGFLPDRDKRRENGEILELGFIGMGSSPSAVFTTVQSLDFYPSAWITDRGLEKQFTIQGGKRQSAWAGVRLEYQESCIRFRFYAASYFFMTEDRGNSGALTISRDSFQKKYLREALLQTMFYFPSESSRFAFSFLNLSLGGSWSDPESAKKEIFFQVSSGVIL